MKLNVPSPIIPLLTYPVQILCIQLVIVKSQDPRRPMISEVDKDVIVWPALNRFPVVRRVVPLQNPQEVQRGVEIGRVIFGDTLVDLEKYPQPLTVESVAIWLTLGPLGLLMMTPLCGF